MATITAADVKKLRDQTGAGMMAAKHALTEADGDFDRAIEVLRTKSETKTRERGAARTAAAGLIAAADGALVELNSETDFVAKNAQFQLLADDIVSVAARTTPSDRDVLLATRLADGRTVGEAVTALASVIGEKIELGRVVVLPGRVVTYMHRRSSDLPPAVGVVVQFEGADEATARATAMQIAAMRPTYLSRDDVPDDVVAHERKIAEATAREEGKPEQALPRIVEGRVNGFFKDVVLLEQASVRESKKSVQAVLDQAGVTVTRFARLEVGAE